MERLKNLKELEALRKKLQEASFYSKKIKVRVCCGTGCRANNSLRVLEELNNSSKNCRLDVEIIPTGCQGLCQKGPLVTVEPPGYFYKRITPQNTKELVESIKDEKPAWELLYRDPVGKVAYFLNDIPFYSKQLRVVLKNNGKIDPTNIYHYIASEGYTAFEKALIEMDSNSIIEEVKKANLRGRGGAGFPAGIKWSYAKRTAGAIKIVIANGDEGDPGAFMDRSIMEGDPHSVLEGMLICALAVGARYGIIYVRHEYPLAVSNLKTAIKQAHELGLLGDNILGTGFSFSIQLVEGAGAFVCGEETALMASVEGKRGMPRPRPPFPVEKGLWEKPTVINNVETLANVPHIINRGADWYLGIGTQTSPGTKIFALTGKVKHTGLIEVPMGITLREIIFDIGGGIPGDRKFKAVQIGGPSGGCIPSEYLGLPVDFDSLKKVGSMMGSGGMVVMDEEDCMVDMAKFFLSFTQAESCGKCIPCRIGTYQMLQILEKITSGQGEPEDIKNLERLGKYVIEGSLCGLGKTAPNPVLTTIKYFLNEYEEHIYSRYCRAKSCSGMYLLSINKDICIQCRRCIDVCPFEAIKEHEDGGLYIDQILCQRCKMCYDICLMSSVEIKEPPLVLIDENGCERCGKCKEVCRSNAIIELSTCYMVDASLCKRCGECIEVCPTGAIRFKTSLLWKHKIQAIK